MKFRNYLTRNLTHHQVTSLPENLGISQKKATMIVDNPSSMTSDSLVKLSKLLRRDPIDLMMEFDCGKSSMTISEAEQLGMQFIEA